MLYAESPVQTDRRRRSVKRGMYQTQITMFTFFKRICTCDGKEIGTTIFVARRLQVTVLLYFLIALTLCLLYAFVLGPGVGDTTSEWDINAMKDYVDLSITGLIFLEATYLTTMIARWWAVRTQCCGALHQSLSFLSMYAAGVWPTSSKSDREARELIARLNLASYQLLFIEARGAELLEKDRSGMAKAVRGLVGAGTLLPEEADVLDHMPDKSAVVVGWLGAFWEEVLGRSSNLECATAFSDPRVAAGRYTVIFDKLSSAKNAIELCKFYLSTQLPYGLVNLLQIVVHMTCLTNSVFCGIHLGTAMKHLHPAHSLVPLTIIRTSRVCLLPVVLDGILLIARIIALPMGLDRDDFVAGAHIEALEDACLAPGVRARHGPPCSMKFPCSLNA